MVANPESSMMEDDGFEIEEQEEVPFSQVLSYLTKPTKNRRDPRTIRMAAVTSALLETVQDKMGSKNKVGVNVNSPLLAASLFAATLNALNGTLSQDTSSVESPQIPLLEILRVVTPYVSTSNPGLFVSQFGLFSRTLRSLITTATSMTDSGVVMETADELGGMNALIRQCIRTATTCLNGILISGNFREKDVLKCFHGCILDLFDEKKPKIRREAHAAAISLLLLSSQLNDNHKHLLEDQIVKYSNFVFQTRNKDSFKGSKKDNQANNAQMDETQLLHLLTFWDKAMAVLSEKSKVKVGEDLIQLIIHATATHTTKLDAFAPSSNQGNQNIMLVNSALNALLSCFEETETDLADDVEFTNFSSRILASLLQNNAAFLSLTANQGECRVVYVRCIIAIITLLFSSKDKNLSKIGVKLMPLSISCILNQSDAHSAQVAQSCLAELGRMVRTCLSYPLQEYQNGDCQKCISDSIEAIEKILHHRFHSYWDGALSVLATFIIKIVTGIIATNDTDENTVSQTKTLVQPLLKGLIRLHGDVNDTNSKKSIEHAVDATIQGIGIEMFLSMISLSKLDEDESSQGNQKRKKKFNVEEGAVIQERVWLLPILKASSSKAKSISLYRPRLSFFQGHILGMARKCDISSARDNATAAECAIQKSRVIELWALFPSFCNNPIDLDVTFPTLCQTLLRAMLDSRYPQLVPIISTGLKSIVESVTDSTLDNQSDLNILTQTSTKILPSLFKLVETLNSDKYISAVRNNSDEGDGSMDIDSENKKKKKKEVSQRAQLIVTLTETIGAYASICPEQFLQTLFKKIMQRLLASTQSEADESERVCTLLGLAQALVKSGALDDVSISLLYRAVRPLVRTDENSTGVQKRSYKVLSEICQRHNQFVLAPERLGEMTELMIDSVFTCQTASRHMRLKCMSLMLNGFKSENSKQMEVIPKIMGEVLLCLKDSNTKTRETAYELLISMAQVYSNITEYFQIVLAALGAQTPHMRSAAVQALSRLVFEFARSDSIVQSFLPSLLQTVCVLFDENAREVIKSVIGFVRVCVAAMTHEQLEPLLQDVVGGIMKYNKGKGRFRSKIKIIMKKLVRKYGYEMITPLVPENDVRLLTHMRKLAEKAERRKAAEGSQEDKEQDSNGFNEMMDSDEDDSDDGRTLMTGITKGSRMTTLTRKSIRSSALSKSSAASMARSTQSQGIRQTLTPKINVKNEIAGNVFDLLDSKMTKNLKYADDNGIDDEFSEDEGAMEFDDSGRLVVHDDFDDDNDDDDSNNLEQHQEDGDSQENEEIHGGGKKRRISKFETAKVARDEANKNNRKKKKNEKQALGAAYKSKKAGGDVKKKGQKYEPFAYVPLDGKKYSKKYRSDTVAQMSTVVRNQNNKRKRR